MPFSGKGKPEPLRYGLKGFWSRRIDQEHRLVYQVLNDSFVIISARFHYDK
jgi:toxin YoeB